MTNLNYFEILSPINLGSILIPCLLYQVEYDWKVGAWAGRRKVKDTWGLVVLKGGKLGDAVVGMEELWERIIVS